jgi:hypothetical protein
MRRLGCPPLWFDPGNRTVLSIQKPWSDGCFSTEAGGPRPTRGKHWLPPRGVQRLALPRTWSRQAVKAAPASPGRLLPPLTADIGAPVGAAMAGGAAWLAEPGDCTSRTLPEPSCLALAPLVAATGVALGAVRRRGFIDDDSDAIRLRNPTRSRRLAGSRACVGDHLRPVTGGTYDSRCRRLGSPQSSPEVPAETQEGPAGTGRGWGHIGRIGVRGSGRWRCRSGARSPTAATRRHLWPGPLRHGRSGPGLLRAIGGCSSPAPGGRYCPTWERPGGSTPSRRTRRTG